MAEYILSLDQGTSSSRALLFSISGELLRCANVPLRAQFPADGWVEQDANEIWTTQQQAMEEVLAGVDCSLVRAIGITNQRETTLAWNRTTGEPLSPAIVWQCRRSQLLCERMRNDGLADRVRSRTGLVIDSYFSASKILWILENIPGVREGLDTTVFGTVDSWILYNLTKSAGAPVFATEGSNASRTMLYDIHRGHWDTELLSYIGIGEDNLAEVRPSAGFFGNAKLDQVLVPVCGMLGDQQASLLGHGCIDTHSVKCTFGTGAFLLVNQGTQAKQSTSGLLSSIAWECNGQREYVLEGSIFVAGALVQWLRDGLGVLASAAESASVAATDSAGVVIIPSFVGLGAPHWRSDVRGAIFGLTRGSSRGHLVRAALEAVAHQVADIFDDPALGGVTSVAIDGGMSENPVFSQILADLTAKSISLAGTSELTALGAARIATVGSGNYSSLREAVSNFGASLTAGVGTYSPINSRESARQLWRNALKQLLS